MAGPGDSASPIVRTSALGRPWRRLTRLLRRPAVETAGPAPVGTVVGELLDVLGDWICALDAMGRIAYANATLARDQGCAEGGLVGRPFLDVVPPGARDAVRLALHRAATTEEPQTCQHETATAGGSSWRQWTFRRMPEPKEADSPAVCLLAAGRDITEQKRLEHQFLHAQRVGSIGMLANGIAHDLNNVLAPIVISVDLLKLRIGSEENRALLDVVATSAGRGASLVGQMLSFSRGLSDHREAVDLASLVKELGRFIDRTFSKSILVRTEVAPDLRRLNANPTQIYQVLLNLCVNARDAMPKGGELTITAGNVTLDEAAARNIPGAAAGEYVMLGVSDTGTGIAPEIEGRIFDPFFTTKPIGEGTGLGLSTVRSILKACGGAITLSTRFGKGTTFHVYFPVKETAATAPAEAPGVENTRGAGECVLVADDEEFFRDVTRRLLEDFGYAVYTAADGGEAVKIFEQHSAEIAVAIVDLNMPVMDGITTIRALRAINPRVRIITVSGSDGAVQPGDDLTNQRLTKPYSMGTLLNCLRQVLSEAQPVEAGQEK
jgi:PAS domain S-box-containing protein